MRVENKTWTCSGAVKIGHSHYEKGQNCQDSFCLSNPQDDQEWLIGVVCDGCGGVEGGRNEVGSALLSDLIVNHLIDCCRRCHDPMISLNYLFGSIEKYIQSVKQNQLSYMPLPRDFSSSLFISQFWLTTILGFVITNDKVIFFSCGDGVYMLDDTIVTIEQDNAPHYLAYRCLNSSERDAIPEGLIPNGFQYDDYPLEGTNKIMIATDGFENHSYFKLVANKQRTEPGLLGFLHGEPWDKKGQTGLKRWMNSRSDLGYFDDDCAIITAERKQNGYA